MSPSRLERPGTQFTRFTSTKVQILTPEKLRAQLPYGRIELDALRHNFNCRERDDWFSVTGTKVQILTLKRCFTATKVQALTQKALAGMTWAAAQRLGAREFGRSRIQQVLSLQALLVQKYKY